ncbi:MAG: prepilin-type N-terminal cleavage/methylation domain-containing protein [Desulfobacteraceae bacterium]|nr:prepilin-type N-terminal cleavage/methylation domain-containing protein [Desulfobacteraceae bacterium]
MGKCYSSKKEKDSGFTLIELLIAMALALVVITSLSSAFISQRKTYAVQEQITEMIQNARAALDMISREVKMAGYDPMGAGIVGIPYSTAQLEIRADLNGNGATSDASEDIVYKFYDSGDPDYPYQIKRKTGAGTFQPFAENIQSFTFKYLESDGTTEVTDAAGEGNIRQIKITVTARTSEPDPDYSQNGYRTYTLTSRITPPNLDL